MSCVLRVLNWTLGYSTAEKPADTGVELERKYDPDERDAPASRLQVKTRSGMNGAGKVRTKVRELDVKSLSRFELEQLALQNAQRVQDLETAAQGMRDLLSPC